MRTGLSLALLLTATAAMAQSISPFQVQTGSYRLHMWDHGNHAVNVAGLWMPGNISLIMTGPDGQFVQYKSEHTPELEVVERRTEDDAEVIVIAGMLSPKLRFTQTTRCADLSMTTTYEVEALADLTDTTIYIAAGPGPKDLLGGLRFAIAGPEGETTGTFPADPAITVNNSRRITWPDLGHRDVSFVFERTAFSKMTITDQGGRYEGHLLSRGAMASGEKRTASCAVLIEFEEGFTGIRPWSEGAAGPVRFDVDGTSGCLHHLRTEQGNLVQHLNLNERADGRNAHQSQAGSRSPGWSGVAELSPTEGESYRAQVSGAVINQWRETVSARAIERGGQVRVGYHRLSADQPADLRLLIYLAQRLEDRGQGFYVRHADGSVTDSANALPMTVGMQQRSAEGGLGPYTDLCEFGPGDEAIIPMPERGEVFTIRCDQPAKLAAFRFEVFFRGLWLEFSNDNAEDVNLSLQVTQMPRREGASWSAPLDDTTGSFALESGRMPVLDAVTPPAGWGAQIETTVEGLRARWTGQPDGREIGLTIDLPVELVGRTVEVLGPGGRPQTPPLCARRLGAELPPEALAAGSTLVIHCTAREQVRLSPGFPCDMALQRKTGDGARLRLSAAEGTRELGMDVGLATVAAQPMRFDTVDPRATDSGLRAEKNGPDVVVTSPWWQVRQSAADGGCVSSIVFFYGDGRNVLTESCTSYLTAAGDTGSTLGSAAILDIVEQTPEHVIVRATGALFGELSLPYVATFEYKSGYLRQKWEYEFGDGIAGVTRFGVQRMSVRPELDEYLARRLTRRTERGRAVFPGGAVFEEGLYARYLCLFERGVEGIEWLSATSVPQWRSQLGEEGHARYAVADGGIIVEPWADAEKPVTISGTKTFEWISGLANIRPQLDRRYFTADLQAPSEEMVRHAAYAGATVLQLGAGIWPGSYQASDPEGTKRIVGVAHEYGLKTFPFDAHALLHRSVTAVSAEQREQWGTERLNSRGERELWVYSAYGDYMCEEAQGWRDYMKRGFAGMMDQYGFDGLYYDFVHPILCYNTRHHPDAPHLSSDSMLEMCEWTARQVGPEGVFAGHTGHVPTIACKNYCTVDVVYEEIGDDQVPSLGRMPEQGQFANIRPKRLVPAFLWNSCLGPGERDGRPARDEDMAAFSARCALIGICPSPRDADISQALREPDDRRANAFVGLIAATRAVDLSTMEFADWRRQTAVTCDNTHLRAACYWNADRALVLIANSESAQTRAGVVRLEASAFGWPADSQVAVTNLPEGQGVTAFGAAELAGQGVALRLDGYSYVTWLLTRLRPPGSAVYCTRAFVEERTARGLRVTTSGPTGQEGRMVIMDSGRAPVRVMLNRGALPPDTVNDLTTVEFLYQTGRPTVVEVEW